VYQKKKFILEKTLLNRLIEWSYKPSNQQPNDRSDLVARVFKLKLKSITNDFFVKGIFEKVIFHIHVIEFQK